MGSHDQERVLALYDPEAVLWGTTSPAIRDNPSSIREYFDFLPTAPPYYKGVLGEQRIRVHGDMAINTGTYTFIGPALTPLASQLVVKRDLALPTGIAMDVG